MDNFGTLDSNSVVNVLSQGMELAIQLKRRLHPNPTSTEASECDSLLNNILSSYDKALNLLNCMALLQNGAAPSRIALNCMLDSPSPRSEESDQDSKDRIHSAAVFKKRKTSPKWSEQVRVCSGTGFEGQLDDGYQWRKYGQKDILGSIHRRAYYRCTHRNTQGCLATKQVQRSDDDPSIFVVVYRGKHSCIHERIKPKKQNYTMVPKKEVEECQRRSQEVAIRTWPHLKTEAQDLNTEEEEERFPCFPFPSTPIDAYENVKFFSEPACCSLVETSCSPGFLSPATSESCFSLSQCPLNEFALSFCLPCADSDFAEIISTPTSVMQLPEVKGSFDDSILLEIDCFQ